MNAVYCEFPFGSPESIGMILNEDVRITISSFVLPHCAFGRDNDDILSIW